ncbi:MAG: energy-coupling factor transporter transmembrane protein EcfT [Oscillospiraceae bacterium]|nr:energy-coupling factor transporter transmembrane protein EcfT [Oscillospiraceae bacterium]
MLKDITMGQFFPGDSLVHRLDPRTKLIMVILYIAALFTAKSYVSYIVMAAFLIISVRISTIKFKMLFKGLKPLIIVIVFTAILNLFFTTGDHVIFEIWRIRLTWEGVRTAAFMLVRLVMLIMGTFLLTYTTSPISLTDGLERLLNPLKKIKVPVHELAMMMSIAMRFIPTLVEETDKIMSAQKARGADFETGSIFERAKALLPVMIPLFISAFRRADELAVAMESRCYHGGEGRTRMNVLHMEKRDWITLLVGVLVLALVIVLNILGL